MSGGNVQGKCPGVISLREMSVGEMSLREMSRENVQWKCPGVISLREMPMGKMSRGNVQEDMSRGNVKGKMSGKGNV